MKIEQFYERIKNGQRVYGTLITSTSAVWAKYIKKTNADFVFIDTEHIPIDRETLAWMCQAFSALDFSPIVRVPSPDPFMASSILDNGAIGIIFPYVESVQEVKDLVGAVKYRPLKGKALQDILDGKKSLTEDLKKYLNSYNQNNLVLINIESVAAMESIDELFSVPGLDGMIIGPHDLSVSLCVPEQYDNPIFQDAVSLIIKKAKEHKIAAGIHYSDHLEHVNKWAGEGLNIIIYKADISFFVEGIGNNIEVLKKSLDNMEGRGREFGIDI